MEHEKMREARFRNSARYGAGAGAASASASGGDTAHDHVQVGAVAVSGPHVASRRKSLGTSGTGNHNEQRLGASGGAAGGAAARRYSRSSGPSHAATYEEADSSRVGAVAVSGGRRVSKTADGRVGAVGVSGATPQRAKGAGPSLAAGAESYDRHGQSGRNPTPGQPMSDRDQKRAASLGRLALLPGSDNYEQSSDRRTSFAEKSRVSVMPAAESYGDATNAGSAAEGAAGQDSKGKAKGPGAVAYKGSSSSLPAKERTGPSLFSAEENYEGSVPRPLPGKESSAISGLDSTPSQRDGFDSVHPEPDEDGPPNTEEEEQQQVPAGAFFITGTGNVVARQPVDLPDQPFVEGEENQENVMVGESQRIIDGTGGQGGDIEEPSGPDPVSQYDFVGADDMKAPKPWYCSWWFIVIAALVVLGGVGGGVGAVLAGGGGGGGDPLTPPPAPTFSPTRFVDPVRVQALTDILLNEGGVDQAALDNATSYQSSALQWLIFDKELSVVSDPPLADETNKILVRFALVCFYYATSGDSWIIKGGWLDWTVDECSWYLVNCERNNGQIDSIGSQQSGNGIQGMLPGELRLLTSLRKCL